MVTVPHSNISKSVQSSKLNHVDLGSPEALNEFFNRGDDVIFLICSLFFIFNFLFYFGFSCVCSSLFFFSRWLVLMKFK